MAALTDLSFEDLIQHAFAHEARPFSSEWYWDDDAEYWDPLPATAVKYLIKLFSNAPCWLDGFSDDQIAQGLKYLIDASIGAAADYGSEDVPARQRAAIWLAVPKFFREILLPRSEETLGHLSESRSSLAGVTYMWWDAFPATYRLEQRDHFLVVDAEIKCLARVLQLRSASCQEAALHGLGHLVIYDRAATSCRAVIDRYLTRGRFPRPELEEYARAARLGCVQ